ncbi:FxsA family protein [Anoxybacteroides amylolyticum]|uniref:FxsA cytoplasmic membrane family protein n=1 Tax=Anoxybacteroides amylolyticum TaxID=294699 RepID=A0A160F6G8_9BACL|nr:FxsA family protein [Anoxybacillus amylolyticus]ANB62188.1 fxsA cytoplasmic membrane family protein [Anoxybacillus amylolyticus]
MRLIVALFLLIPLVEVALFVLSGQLIGVWSTVFLILFTGVLGAALAKWQGKKVIEAVKREMMYGRLPSGAVLDSICVLAGGLLLLTPGFFTDIIGFLLLLPATRRWMKPLLARWLKALFDTNVFFYIKK